MGTKLRLEVKERQRSGGRGSFLSGSVSSSISTSHEATTPGNKNLEKMVQHYHCIAGTNESDGVQLLTKVTQLLAELRPESGSPGPGVSSWELIFIFSLFCLQGPMVVITARKFM